MCFIAEKRLSVTPWFDVASMKNISSGSDPNFKTKAAWSANKVNQELRIVRHLADSLK